MLRRALRGRFAGGWCRSRADSSRREDRLGWRVAVAKERFDLVHHPLDVAVGSDADHPAVAGPRIAPLEDLDRHATDAPLTHRRLARLVEVDGVHTREGEAVVVHLVDLPCRPDPEHGSARPARPVGGRTVDRPAPELGAQCGQVTVSPVITLGVCVGGGPDLLDRSPR